MQNCSAQVVGKTGKRCVVDTDTLQERVWAFLVEASTPGFDPVRHIEVTSDLTTAAVTPLRYVDPDAVKELCAQRRQCTSRAQRASISVHIHSARKLARVQWKQALVVQAASGSWKARSALQRVHRKSGTYTGLIDAKGSEEAAAEALKRHYVQQFESVPPEHRLVRAVQWNQHDLSLEPPVTEQELRLHLDKLRPFRSAGLSGVSADLLKAICNLDGGVECLLRLLGHVFDDPACDADVLYRGLAVLVPKVSCVLEPKQTRPLVLTETITKLAARVAMHRVLESWPVVDECMGGRRGLQVSDAVCTAKTMLAKSKVFDCDAVFCEA